jgi:hypothetical protein
VGVLHRKHEGGRCAPAVVKEEDSLRWRLGKDSGQLRPAVRADRLGHAATIRGADVAHRLDLRLVLEAVELTLVLFFHGLSRRVSTALCALVTQPQGTVVLQVTSPVRQLSLGGLPRVAGSSPAVRLPRVLVLPSEKCSKFPIDIVGRIPRDACGYPGRGIGKVIGGRKEIGVRPGGVAARRSRRKEKGVPQMRGLSEPPGTEIKSQQGCERTLGRSSCRASASKHLAERGGVRQVRSGRSSRDVFDPTLDKGEKRFDGLEGGELFIGVRTSEDPSTERILQLGGVT